MATSNNTASTPSVGNNELVHALTHSQSTVVRLRHLFDAITGCDDIEQARSLAELGEDFAGMHVDWLGDMVCSEAIKAGLKSPQGV